MEKVFHIKVKRFYLPHGQQYCFISAAIAALFFLDKLTKLIIGVPVFTYLVTSICICARHFRGARMFSNNLFRELKVQDLENEYRQTEGERDNKIVDLTKMMRTPNFDIDGI